MSLGRNLSAPSLNRWWGHPQEQYAESSRFESAGFDGRPALLMEMPRVIHGAKWLKVDLHAHSPGSGKDWKGPSPFSPKDWLLCQMQAGLDCVAVTDHNSGAWIDPLKSALAELIVEQPAGFRPLVLFPGVEISVHGGIHLLALFDPSATTERVHRLLPQIGYHAEFGITDACCEQPLHKAVEAITRSGGLAIPAHVLDANGWFTVQGRPGQGPTLEQSLRAQGLLAIERTSSGVLPQLYRDSKLQLAEVVGSDSHEPAQAGRRFTWVKMETPSIVALRLAMHDGEDGVLRDDESAGDPNALNGRFFISRIEVRRAYKAGRDKPLEVTFSPWLTSIIGGRGAGKSSIVQFLRVGLNKTKDLPAAALREFESFREQAKGRGTTGMFRPDTEIRIELQRDSRLIAFTWSSSGWREEEWVADTGQWALVGSPDRPEDRVPVRIFSQKQLYELTEDSRALLNIVDEAAGRSRLDEQRRDFEEKWLASRRVERSLISKRQELQNLLSERKDVAARLHAIEDPRRKAVLANYRAKQQTHQKLADYAKLLEDYAATLLTKLETAPKLALREESRAEIGEESSAILDALGAEWRKALAAVQTEARPLVGLAEQYKARAEGLPWQAEYRKAVQEYTELEEQTDDASTFDSLEARRAELDARIAEAEKAAKSHEEQARESERLRLTILQVERELRAKRAAVLDEWNGAASQQGIRAVLRPLADAEDGERSLRKLLRKETEFGRTILERDDQDEPKVGLLADIVNSPEEERWQKLEETTALLCAVSEGEDRGLDRRLARHLQTLRQQTPEDLDRIRVWVPEDQLVLRLVKDGKESDVEVGSAGQRTAGMLALLMARGDGPLVIDQPEDDLDTRRISEQVVRGLRLLKKKQQVIVVTHNPNIPVNGGAEHIVEMRFAGGQVRRQRCGALQNLDVRTAVCEVMEGGRDALDKRYFRISRALAPEEST